MDYNVHTRVVRDPTDPNGNDWIATVILLPPGCARWSRIDAEKALEHHRAEVAALKAQLREVIGARHDPDDEATIARYRASLEMVDLFFENECVPGSPERRCGQCAEPVPWTDEAETVICRSCVVGAVRRALEGK